MKEYQLYRALVLLSRSADARHFLSEYDVAEREENQELLELMRQWHLAIEQMVTDGVISTYFAHAEELSEANLRHLESYLNDRYEDHDRTMRNMRFVPMQHPYETLRFMVQQRAESLRDEWQLERIFFKVIPELNFHQSLLTEPDLPTAYRDGFKLDPDGTAVLSMSSAYLENPFGWPLIFHEYGHAIYERLKTNPIMGDVRDKIRKNHHDVFDNSGGGAPDAVLQEIFADLVGINLGGINYFLAFLFHVVAPKTRNELMPHLVQGSQIPAHPPTGLRLEYMLTELHKRGWSKTRLMKQVVALVKGCLADVGEKKGAQTKKAVHGMYEDAATRLSREFDGAWKIGPPLEPEPLVAELVKRLEAKRPVATQVPSGEVFEVLLATDGAVVEQPVRIHAMIQAAWSYYLGYLCDISRPTSYLVASEEDKNSFRRDYRTLLQNLAYSMETALVASNIQLGENP